MSAGKRTYLLYAAIVAYFTLYLSPHVIPRLTHTPYYFLYFLTFVPVVFTTFFLFIGCILVLPIAWLRDKSLKRCRSLLLFASFGLLCCASVIALNNRLLPPGSYRQQFDAASWRQINTKLAIGEISARQKMLADVVKNVLPGRSRNEMEELLGPSEEKNETELIYNLGRTRRGLFPLADEWLVITLDASARFKDYEISDDD